MHLPAPLASPESPVPQPVGPQQKLARRYALVERVLRANIARKHLPEGLVLLEAPLAAVLQTSRAPVQRALLRLEEDDLIHRFEGRGFLVGNAASRVPPLRTDVRDIGLVVSDEVDEALQTRNSGEWIVADLEQAVSACLVFGEFRMVEAEVASHYNVSRTVIRDVLGRLQERGLLRKTQSSRWIAGPLTAHALKDCYDLRSILEPPALLSAAPKVDRAALLHLHGQISGSPSAHADAAALFGGFLDLCVTTAPNTALGAMVRQNMSVLDAATRSLARLGLPQDDAALTELRMTVELLLNGSAAAAAEWWRDHLKAACRRSIAQLKIVAIIARPNSIPPYLVAV
ncbi:GntR family transcriptional regulator [Lichenifustis flavocetrariae]|uniref:GntR family transcriptional regulator n=1 Tax=Lichenifustis flavocetrariae TaxID=2949735 RepID=A0AA41YWJ4_9HYPH|nr:GntR family transcriptional regulator [Lichenifustis flavocetrariae]MCW6508293.1 GntR family transcriptional regulator [Lichenifustis flavocetrariae]